MKTIPDVNRVEWREIVTGALEVTLNSYLVKSMLSQTKEQLHEKSISLDEAVINFHANCIRFSHTGGVLEDVNLIFNQKEQQEKRLIKQDKKEQLNFEVEDLSVANTLIKKEKYQFVNKEKEMFTPIDKKENPNLDQVPEKLKPTIPVNSKKKELNVVDNDVISTKSTIANTRLKEAKESTAFEDTLKQEIKEKKPIIKNSKLEKEELTVKPKLKTKTSSISTNSPLDTTKATKKSFLEKISTIFYSEE